MNPFNKRSKPLGVRTRVWRRVFGSCRGLFRLGMFSCKRPSVSFSFPGLKAWGRLLQGGSFVEIEFEQERVSEVRSPPFDG